MLGSTILSSRAVDLWRSETCTWQPARLPSPFQLPQLLPRFEEVYARSYCFSAHYIYHLLVSGYKFTEDTWPKIHFKKEVSRSTNLFPLFLSKQRLVWVCVNDEPDPLGAPQERWWGVQGRRCPQTLPHAERVGSQGPWALSSVLAGPVPSSSHSRAFGTGAGTWVTLSECLLSE